MVRADIAAHAAGLDHDHRGATGWTGVSFLVADQEVPLPATLFAVQVQLKGRTAQGDAAL